MTEPSTAAPPDGLPPPRKSFALRYKIELAVIVAIYLLVGYVIVTQPNQLLTPPSLLWRVGVVLIGMVLAARIFTIGVTSRMWAPRPKAFAGRANTITLNLVVAAVLIFLTFVIWRMAAYATASAYEFRNGGTRATGSFRVIRLVMPSGPTDDAGLLINPYHLMTPARISISRERARQLQSKWCLGNSDCSDAGRCVEVPYETTSSGAARLLIKDSTVMDAIELAGCGPVSM